LRRLKLHNHKTTTSEDIVAEMIKATLEKRWMYLKYRNLTYKTKTAS